MEKIKKITWKNNSVSWIERKNLRQRHRKRTVIYQNGHGQDMEINYFTVLQMMRLWEVRLFRVRLFELHVFRNTFKEFQIQQLAAFRISIFRVRTKIFPSFLGMHFLQLLQNPLGGLSVLTFFQMSNMFGKAPGRKSPHYLVLRHALVQW